MESFEELAVRSLEKSLEKVRELYSQTNKNIIIALAVVGRKNLTND